MHEPRRLAATRRPLRHLAAVIAAVALLGGAAHTSSAAGATPADPPQPSVDGAVALSRTEVSTAGPVGERHLVVLDAAVSAASSDVAGSPSERIRGELERLGGEIRRDLASAGVFAVNATAAQAEQMAELAGVAEVVPDAVLRPADGPPPGGYRPHRAIASSAGHHGWPDAGAGTTIGIIDTGIDRTYPPLADKVIVGACFSTTSGGFESSCDDDDPGAPCSAPGCVHGTRVAAVAAGRVTTASATHLGGIAPGANVASAQVFSLDMTSAGCSTGCPLAFTADVLAALNWLADIADEVDLTSVNLSLGGTPGHNCSSDVGGPTIRRLTEMGIPVVAATGNEGDPHQIGWPACHPDVVAVAATAAQGSDWDNPVVSHYNAGPGVAIAAPGRSVPIPLADDESSWVLANGTSFASPAVAAAAAVWRAHHPAAPLGDLIGGISAGTVTDTRTAATYPRLSMAPLYPTAPTPPTTTTTSTTTTTAPPPPETLEGGRLVASSPRRALDTRTASGCVAGARRLPIAGSGGVPANATSVVMNVTVTGARAPGYLTVHPDGTALPVASNLNFAKGQTVPNLVTARVGAGGAVRIYASGGCPHVVADVIGYHTGGPSGPGGFQGIDPTRALDTRRGGQGPCVAEVAGRSLLLGGRSGVPAGATAVTLNVTVTGARAPGYLTVYPGGTARPTASNLNYAAGQTVPNQVTTKLGADGTIRIYASGGCPHVVVDVAGYYHGGEALPFGFVGIAPNRVADTRRAVQGPCVAGVRKVMVAPSPGVPFDATAVSLNVTVTGPTAPGYLTVYPGATPRPHASNLNYNRGQTVPNAVLAAVGPDGTIEVYASGGCPHVVVDVNGYHSGPPRAW